MSKGKLSRNKGASGERELARELSRLLRVDARRGQQHCGGPDSPEDAPKTMRVDYQIGLDRFVSEWLCPEQPGLSYPLKLQLRFSHVVSPSKQGHNAPSFPPKSKTGHPSKLALTGCPVLIWTLRGLRATQRNFGICGKFRPRTEKLLAPIAI